jgi:hypothetical protein
MLIIRVDGLVNIFSTVKTTPLAKDLPPNYRAVLEWGRITYVLSHCFEAVVSHYV